MHQVRPGIEMQDGTPERFADDDEGEVEKWVRVIPAAGITPTEPARGLEVAVTAPGKLPPARL